MQQAVDRRVVVALGGNAITRSGTDDSVDQDYRNLRRSLKSIAELVERGYQVVLTHGNGPQVGNQMIRVELARGHAPELPLDIVVADLQGGMGYMIERVLRNKLRTRGLETPVCALLTLVEIDPTDPALGKPSKFVGSAYTGDEATQLSQRQGWLMREDIGRGWRRVVPSPRPINIIERDQIQTLVETGALVIVTGGGGIPVARNEQGLLRGVEAVIDKDFTSQLLAEQVRASELFILTGVAQVVLNFGQPDERPLACLSASEARAHLVAGQFPAGSMGPKIEAACRFVEHTGRRALITDTNTLIDAMAGKTGTWVEPDPKG